MTMRGSRGGLFAVEFMARNSDVLAEAGADSEADSTDAGASAGEGRGAQVMSGFPMVGPESSDM